MIYAILGLTFICLVLIAYMIWGVIPKIQNQIVTQEQFKGLKNKIEQLEQNQVQLQQAMEELEGELRQTKKTIIQELSTQNQQNMTIQEKQHKTILHDIQHGLQKIDNTIREPIV